MSGGPIDMIAKSVGSGIGFVSEARQYRKAKKAAVKERELEKPQAHNESRRSTSSSPSPPTTDSQNDSKGFYSPDSITGHDETERTWDLDEAQEVVVEAKKPRKSKDGVANPDKVIAAFLQRQPSPYFPQPTDPNYMQPVSKLQYPVAMPQRRPSDKGRGFMPAYAPDLQNVGIDQDSWIDFIETFNEACLPNPWINALNLASLAASPLPGVIAQAISTAIMVATTVAMEVQGRYR